jgi:hypothetical protein
MPQHGGKALSQAQSANSHEQDVEQHCLHGIVADEAAHALVVHYEGVHANEQDEPADAPATAAVQVSDAALAAQFAQSLAQTSRSQATTTLGCRAAAAVAPVAMQGFVAADLLPQLPLFVYAGSVMQHIRCHCAYEAVRLCSSYTAADAAAAGAHGRNGTLL